MRKISTSTITLFLFCLLNWFGNMLFAQVGPAITWQKCIGGSADDRANDVLINPDGTFIIAGYSNSNDGNISGHHGTAYTTSDALIAKLDANGNLVWQKSIGGSNNDFINTIIATNDGGYMCAGYTNSNDGDITNAHGNNDAWVIKINATGNIIWSKCYGGSRGDTATDIVLTPDGQYAVMATSSSVDGDVLSGLPTRTDADGWVFKINNTGNILWETCINNAGAEDKGYNIIQSDDNNLFGIVSSSEYYYYNPGPEQQLIRRDPGYFYHIDNSTGYVQSVGNLGGDSAFAMCRLGDSICFARTELTWTYPQSCYIYNAAIGERQNGNNNISLQGVFWVNNCDFGAYYYRLAGLHGIAGDDNTLIGVGHYYDGIYGVPSDPWSGGDAIIATRLVRFNTNQTTYKVKKYGGTRDDRFSSIKVFPAGNEYIAVGYTASYDGDVSGNHGSYDCWVVRLEGLNKVNGNVFLDANNNGVRDAGELPFDHDIVKTTKSGFTQSGLPYNGSYMNFADTGTYVTTLALNRPYYSFTPANKISVFNSYQNTDIADFAVHATPGIQDYTLSAAALTQARPGFLLQYKILYNNVGTTMLTNKLITFVKDSRTTLIGSAPLYTSVSGDTIRWNLASLPPITGGNIILNLETGIPPTINAGDVLISNALIDSTGDTTPVDNYTVINQTVTGSYDPNDKKENFGGEIYPPDIAAGKYLNYTIRFQNTGNDTAFTIILRDTLDNKLLGDSIEVIAASHPYQVNIKDNKYLTVAFNNIKLADSLHNEPLSHGYFSYRIKPASSLITGDTIRNSASIYFDFNLPVRTNTEITIVKPTPSTNFWTGAVSTAWEDSNNWGNHLVPDENTNVIINTGLLHYPVISSNAICKTINAKPGTSVLVKSGFILQVTH